MKRFIILFSCLCLIMSQLGVTVFASSFEASYDYKAAMVSISGQSVPGDDIDIIVFKTGDEMTPENCIHVNQVKGDDNGVYSLEFVMPSAAVSAEYTVYVSGRNKVVHTDTFCHNNAGLIVASLKDAATIADFKAVLTANSNVLTPEFVAANDTVIDMMLGSSFETIAGYENHFANMQALYDFSISSADGMKAIFDSKAAELGMVVTGDYAELSDKTNVFSVAKQNGFDIKDMTTVNDALKVGVIFTLLRDGGVIKLDTIVNYVKNNYALLGITQATAENENLAEGLKAMLGSTVSTTGTFANNLSAAINALYSNSGSSSSGGGGGGGGSVSIKNGTGKIPAAVAAPEEPVKKNFTDLNNVPWAVEAINALADCGVVSGVSDTEFNPDANVTREQFVKMFVLALGITDDNAKSEFSDIPASHWSYPYVSDAVALGVVNGIGNGSFGAGQKITRQDMAVMLYRAASVSRIALLEKTSVSFGDEAEIADYAKTAVETMSKAGIINGSDGLFMPEANATRAQAAKMIYEILKLKEVA